MQQSRRTDRQPPRWLRIGIPVVLVLVWLIGGSVGGPYFGKVD
jgi:RND superfamily putative drug exporter